MKLPPQAEKVFTGKIFDVYQWQQEMFDGSFETFEMLKRTGTVDVIATQGDTIFVSKQSQPTNADYYSLFGGRIDENETPLAAAKRELCEESGIESNSWELYKTYQPVHKIDWEISFFIAKNCTKIADQKLDAGERIEIIRCTFDEFINIVLHPKFTNNELTMDILRMKNAGTLEEFKRKIFE